MRIDTQAGQTGSVPITFSQGTGPIACRVVGAPAGVSVAADNRINWNGTQPAGTYDFSLVCDGCNGSSDSIPIELVVAAVQTPTINSLATIESDMTLPNDSVLRNVNPAFGWADGPGQVVMGPDGRRTRAPEWWRNANPELVNDDYLNYLLYWWVIFEGTNNTANNIAIELRRQKGFISYNANQAWQLISTAEAALAGDYFAQASNYNGGNEGEINFESTADGVKVATRPDVNPHGYFGGRQPINGSDVRAIHGTLQARLVAANPALPVNFDAADYSLHTGADYYVNATGDEGVKPGVGLSRAKRLTTEWQSISMTTLSDRGVQEPGGGITFAELVANPPPLD